MINVIRILNLLWPCLYYTKATLSLQRYSHGFTEETPNKGDARLPVDGFVSQPPPPPTATHACSLSHFSSTSNTGGNCRGLEQSGVPCVLVRQRENSLIIIPYVMQCDMAEM